MVLGFLKLAHCSNFSYTRWNKNKRHLITGMGQLPMLKQLLAPRSLKALLWSPLWIQTKGLVAQKRLLSILSLGCGFDKPPLTSTKTAYGAVFAIASFREQFRGWTSSYTPNRRYWTGESRTSQSNHIQPFIKSGGGKKKKKAFAEVTVLHYCTYSDTLLTIMKSQQIMRSEPVITRTSSKVQILERIPQIQQPHGLSSSHRKG